MKQETKYIIVNKENNLYYQEFDGFQNTPRFTSTIHHAWFFYIEADAKQMIKDIMGWLYEHKKENYKLEVTKVEFNIHI